VRSRTVFTLFVLFLVLGLVPVSADSVIQRGIDVFTTPGDGKTFYDFAKTPIPAGFFCKGSKPFTGKVAFKGLPLATGSPEQLWGADTVIERLDDAVFDEKGVAMTRLQFRALSLVSISPVKTACGAYHVYVSLTRRQRITEMSILRTQEGGGNFVAPLAADVRMTFIPVKPSARNKGERKLELTESFTFPASPLPWSFKAPALAKGIGSVIVDTDGDLKPDTRLPGFSNFSPGKSTDRPTMNKWGDLNCPGCAVWSCHSAEGHEHCYWEPTPPGCLEPMIC
jgi:hypothetical protein